MLYLGKITAASRRLSLITSDAADDLIGVDLGGRRIIKKKTTVTMWFRREVTKKNNNQKVESDDS